MKFFRNKEVTQALLLQGALSAVAVVAAFFWDRRFGLFTLVFSAVLLLLTVLITYKRYKQIYDLSADIDRILHGDTLALGLSSCREGELGILHSEIHKMTVRLREQTQQLQDDKIYLADSIADISHQIRTPLTSINLLVQLLSAPNIADDRRMALTRELLGLLSRIDWLITTLLKMSRLDAGTVRFNARTLPIQQLLEKAVSPLLVPMELRQQQLLLKAEGNFTGDEAWTVEAIGNIVKNCMEHTPEGGIVALEASENPLYCEITVSDNGSGIDKEDLPHIFERFYKGKNSDEKSFGIGLSLARTIITSQNGTVKAENGPTNGAVFTIRFYK